SPHLVAAAAAADQARAAAISVGADLPMDLLFMCW
ncbi:unnamed protein product, partial [Urochloa humidicola]